MTYCRVCGSPTRTKCCEPAAVRCVPAHVPIDGYVTLDQLSSLADAMDSQPSLNTSKEDTRTKQFSMFSLSMGLVKWTGGTVICLLVILFLTILFKAFM